MIDLGLRVHHHHLSICAKAVRNLALLVILTLLFLLVPFLVLQVQLKSAAILLVHVA